MAKWKKTISLALIAVMAGLTACSSNGGGGNADPSASPSATNAGSGNEAPAELEKKSIRVVFNNGGRKFPDGMDENNNPYIDYIRENTNLDITLQLPPADGYQDALNVIMASGDLPDSIYTWDASWFESYVKQKALQPLNEALEQYGQDLLKNIPEDAWKTVTIDGNIYAIPSMNAVPGNELMYVRKDWLDHLGLQPPKTLEEYREVMRAFKEDDPDGDGQDDTYGFIMAENLARMAPFVGAFGIQKGMWTERDGQLVNASTLPEMKEALAFIAGLHKDGLIDPEWMLNKEANFSEKIASGQVGLFSAFWYDTRGPILTSKQNDPKAEWIPLEFPTGPQGKQGTTGYGYIAGYNVVPVTSKNPDAVVRMLNFMNGEGYKTLLLGFENEVWKTENGKIVTDFEKHNEHIYRQTLGESIRPYGAEEERARLDSLGVEFKLNDNIDRIAAVAIRDQYLGVPTPGMGKHQADLTKLETEYFTEIIVGKQPIEAFDEFVAEWKKKGGDTITEEVNAWYAENK
ncbi:extracellular solute-binding protein [Paenibacillus soyae]|uniref:Extracellular solute-binding protein n=1 Tax=Paenibacillus soyae TaxID=2969249 RepID=A0A9X2N217_9BACL|nr:extracellular solute-binding protein [Paenibacillus soyae]MCR2807582.1 extracellular solute-binding protein [Paenibacillus soyae]